MSEPIDQDGDSVKPVKRDKLRRLRAQLDAAEKAGDVPSRLIRQYQKMVAEQALATPLPKVIIKTTADYWEAEKMEIAAFARVRTIKDELNELQFRDDATWRQTADMQALLKLAQRNWLHIAERMLARAAAKKRSNAAWRRADRIVTIPQRDRQVRHG